MNNLKLLNVFILCQILIVPISYAGKYEHVLGETYDIVERHPTDEIKEATRKVDWKETYSKAKTLNLPIADISRATRNREFIHEVINKIDMDVTNPSTGEILYPKGYTFNPLDYLKLPKFIVISDHKKDIEWLETQDIDMNTMILTVGDPFSLSQTIKRKVMILKEDLKEKLKIGHYPAIAQQIGNKIKVTEFNVPL